MSVVILEKGEIQVCGESMAIASLSETSAFSSARVRIGCDEPSCYAIQTLHLGSFTVNEIHWAVLINRCPLSGYSIRNMCSGVYGFYSPVPF